MPPAARVTDTTGHGSPLSAGPGAATVFIGYLPAWRAVPAGVGGAVEAVSNSMKTFMSTPMHTPPSATPQLIQISAGLMAAAAAAAASSVSAAAAGSFRTRPPA